MRRTYLILFEAATVLGFASIDQAPVAARGPYQKSFEKVYPDLAAKKVNCRVCHPRGSEDNMKSLNHYSIALAKELGEKKVKDEQRVMDALRTIAKGECRSGKWTERLERGLAPCVCGAIEPENSIIERLLKKDDYKFH